MPAQIVEPLLEIPGKTATACASPIGITVFKHTGKAFCLRFATISVTSSSVAVHKKNTARQIHIYLPKNTLSKSKILNRIPVMPAGIVASTRKPSVLKGFLNSARISRQNTTHTATSVPRCRMIVKNKAVSESLIPNTPCKNAICPEDETGKNSVKPCTKPSMTACQISIL